MELHVSISIFQLSLLVTWRSKICSMVLMASLAILLYLDVQCYILKELQWNPWLLLVSNACYFNEIEGHKHSLVIHRHVCTRCWYMAEREKRTRKINYSKFSVLTPQNVLKYFLEIYQSILCLILEKILWILNEL